MKLFFILSLFSLSTFASPDCTGTDSEGNKIRLEISGGRDDCRFLMESYNVTIYSNRKKVYKSQCVSFDEYTMSYSTEEFELSLDEGLKSGKLILLSRDASIASLQLSCH